MKQPSILRIVPALVAGALVAAGNHVAAAVGLAPVRLEWRFSTPALPAIPETANTGAESGRAEIQPGTFSTGWQGEIPGFGAATGCWDLGRSGAIILRLPSALASAGMRQLRVKVTQWVDGGIYESFAAVEVRGAARGLSLASPVTSGPVGGWMEDLSVWEFPGGAGPAEIVIRGRAGGSVVDRIVVEAGAGFEAPALLGIRAVGGDGARVELFWPATLSGFVLEQSSRLGMGGGWEPVPGRPLAVGDELRLTIESGAGAGFFRLRKP